LSGKAKVDTDSKKIKETSEPKATGD
jgi:hypothetical protein